MSDSYQWKKKPLREQVGETGKKSYTNPNPFFRLSGKFFYLHRWPLEMCIKGCGRVGEKMISVSIYRSIYLSICHPSDLCLWDPGPKSLSDLVYFSFE